MPDELSALGEADVSRLLAVIEILEHSTFDFLQLEIGDMKVVIGKGDPPGYAVAPSAMTAGQAASDPAASRVTVVADVPSPPRAAAPAATAGPLMDPEAEASVDPATSASGRPAVPDADAEGTVTVRAPMMGIFYAQPEPGAPPYVTVGSAVGPDTTVGLVEVMKMFNAIRAGAAGTVAAVLVETNQLVEYDQPLFLVHPAEGA